MQMLIISTNNDFIEIEKNWLLQGTTKFEKKCIDLFLSLSVVEMAIICT